MTQLRGLVDAGNTVVVVEHDMDVVAGSDWVIDVGPGAGDEGGAVVVAGTPATVTRDRRSRTAAYLRGRAAGPSEFHSNRNKNNPTCARPVDSSDTVRSVGD